MYFIRSPRIFKKLFPDIIWDTKEQDGRLRISFDDGPSAHTEEILAILDHHDIQASFFCLGRQVERFPEQFEMIKAGGHLIGHHGYDHLDGWKTDRAAYLRDLHQAESIFAAAYFRPPYGRMSWAQYQEIKSEKTIVMWSAMLGDFDPSVSAEKCNARLKKTTSTDIILLHDNDSSYPKNISVLASVVEHRKQLNYNK